MRTHNKFEIYDAYCHIQVVMRNTTLTLLENKI